MHSVHISCLKGVSYCIICEKGITDAVKKLSVAASSSYLGDSGNCHQSSESTSSVDGDDPGDLEECISANETNVEQLLVGLTQKVISLQSQLQPPPVAKPSVPTEPLPTRQQINTERKTNHCNKCKHLRQGHRKRGNEFTCRRCPGEICMTDGGQIPCNCSWHSKLSY